MSGEAFLRAHGWKLGRELWWHRRLPDAGHDMGAAILQQAQWLADWNERARVLMLRAEMMPAMAGTDVGIKMSILLVKGERGT